MPQGVEGYFGHIQSSGQGPTIQSFYIIKNRLRKTDMPEGNQPVHEGIKDKGVIGTWRIADAQLSAHYISCSVEE
jgi:hypothetical protein